MTPAQRYWVPELWLSEAAQQEKVTKLASPKMAIVPVVLHAAHVKLAADYDRLLGAKVALEAHLEKFVGKHTINYVIDLEQREAQLVAALERLGSMEAFDLARSIDHDRDRELLMRIEYARTAISQAPTGPHEEEAK